MKLENQVCAKEYGEKLAALGVECESLFFWQEYEAEDDQVLSEITHYRWDSPPAYTVAELGEMLPDYYKSFRKQCGEWACSNFAACVGKAASLSAETEANARAKMLVYLLENGHIKAEELNAKENKG